MNVVLTQNFYNLMNSIHNTQDSGVPTEFSNSPDVDGGRNIITMKTGTVSNKIYHPSGVQRIIQLGKYGYLSPDASPSKVRLYAPDLATYEEKNCVNGRYSMQDLLNYPGTIRSFIDTAYQEYQWNRLSFAPSSDTTPITRETTVANEDLPILSVTSDRTMVKNGFITSLKYEGSTDFQMNKIYIAMPASSTPILLAGINLPNTVLLEPNTVFNLFLGCTAEFV